MGTARVYRSTQGFAGVYKSILGFAGGYKGNIFLDVDTEVECCGHRRVLCRRRLLGGYLPVWKRRKLCGLSAFCTRGVLCVLYCRTRKKEPI